MVTLPATAPRPVDTVVDSAAKVDMVVDKVATEAVEVKVAKLATLAAVTATCLVCIPSLFC